MLETISKVESIVSKGEIMDKMVGTMEIKDRWQIILVTQHKPTRTASSRPFIPTFTPRVLVQPVVEPQIVDLHDQFQRDWESGGQDFQAAITLRDYIDVRMRHASCR